MGLFNNFPYLNFHELNLDWLLKKTKSLEKDVEEIKTYKPYTDVSIVQFTVDFQGNVTANKSVASLAQDLQAGKFIQGSITDALVGTSAEYSLKFSHSQVGAVHYFIFDFAPVLTWSSDTMTAIVNRTITYSSASPVDTILYNPVTKELTVETEE